MGTHEHEISRIRVQITVARWHLQSALSGVADAAVRELECARLAYAEIVRSLSDANLTKKEREELGRELGVLESRLQGAREPAPEVAAVEDDAEPPPAR